MYWKDDPNKELKDKILNLIVYGLNSKKSHLISIKKIHDTIDEMFQKLNDVSPDEKKE
jgi:hypothetical protein